MGSVSYINIAPEDQRLEIGHIWYVPRTQGAGANTEITYLMLKHAFEDLGYTRVEWKSNNLNFRSVAAATKLGFSFEGTQRQKITRKEQNRDTAFFSMLVEEWEHSVKSMLENRLALYAEQDHLPVRELSAGSAEFPNYAKSLPYLNGDRFSLVAC